jgi:stalled ribosome rescue protein Dom34
MSNKNKKQFGIWMDSHHATVVGKEDFDTEDFLILGHVKNQGADNNSNEKTSNNQDIALTNKFFKEISSLMPNVDEIHVTGTGIVQAQFRNFLSETPHYKNAIFSESTSNKMSDENVAEFIMKQFK